MSVNLNRSAKNNIAIYQTDGFGRDSYILFNNGGFWKNRPIKLCNIYKPIKKLILFHSIFRQPPPFNYINDGTGRDSYVKEHNGGLIRDFEPLAKQSLQTFLRKDDEKNLFKSKLYYTKPEKKYLKKIKKIQTGVITRLYRDSLTKIQKNNLELRNNSFNNLLSNKKKISPLKGAITPKIGIKSNNSISLKNISKFEEQKLKKNNDISFNSFLPKSSIFERIKKNTLNCRLNDKNKSFQYSGILDSKNINNRKLKLLKKIKIIKPVVNRINIDVKNDNNNFSKTNNFFRNQNLNKNISSKKIFINNTSVHSPINNLDDFHFINKIRKTYRINNDFLKRENFSMNDINKKSELDMKIKI